MKYSRFFVHTASNGMESGIVESVLEMINCLYRCYWLWLRRQDTLHFEKDYHFWVYFGLQLLFVIDSSPFLNGKNNLTFFSNFHLNCSPEQKCILPCSRRFASLVHWVLNSKFAHFKNQFNSTHLHRTNYHLCCCCLIIVIAFKWLFFQKPRSVDDKNRKRNRLMFIKWINKD